MTKVCILSGQADEYTQLVINGDLPELELVRPDANLSDVEVVFGEPSLLRPVLGQLTSLRWVQATWAGVEPLLDPALRRDYALTNARGVFGRLMSEYVIAYLLLHERKILERIEAQFQGLWEPCLTGTLQGKTIGLMGVGSIGAEVARTAKFFGMKVRGYTRASEDCPDVDAYYHGIQIETFARGLDYLVGLMPNTGATRGLINASLLEQLPPTALLINAGRGSALDEDALIEALWAGRLAGAVLDVFQQEPLPAAHPFWTTPNLLITSHSSAPSLPGDIARLFYENYKRFVAGQPLTYQVDFERGY